MIVPPPIIPINSIPQGMSIEEQKCYLMNTEHEQIVHCLDKIELHNKIGISIFIVLLAIMYIFFGRTKPKW